jgi:hypothetical protein
MTHHTDTINGKALGATNTEGLDTHTTNGLNFAIAVRLRKAFAKLIVEFAIRGYASWRAP